jgi:septum site-determining protein MinC
VLRVRGRSFVAISLVPEPPLPDWLAELERQMARAPGFFAGRPVVVDLSSVGRDDPALPGLLPGLAERGVRVIGVEGVDPDLVDLPAWNWPPRLRDGRNAAGLTLPDEAAIAEPLPEQPNTLIIDRPVRSGQTVMFPGGDVTVLGAVSSGAEIIAGGSIHIYGVLRGRAIAGFTGNARARIFCRKLDAELLSIDGLYRTAEEMPANLRGSPAQAWLDGDKMQMAALA